MDWAEIEARKLMFCMTPSGIAAALRKAKADGYKLGLEVSLTTIRSMHEQTVDSLTDELRASAIEKGME